MKHLFSSLMIVSCTGFYTSYGQNGLTIATTVTMAPNLQKFELALQAEHNARSFLSLNKDVKSRLIKENRQKMHDSITISRGYLKEILEKEANPEIIAVFHRAFFNFLQKQLSLSFYTSPNNSQYKNDTSLLEALQNKISYLTFTQDHPTLDLTKSVVCTSAYETTNTALQKLLQEQQQIEQQSCKIAQQIIYEQQKQNYVKQALKQKKENKKELVDKKQAEREILTAQIEKLTKEREEMDQQLTIEKTSLEKIDELLNDFHIVT